MTREEINEGNRLILEFMGIKPKSVIPNIYYWNDSPFFYVSEDTEEKVMNSIVKYAKYDYSWDWLIPVIIKISNDTQWTLVMEENSSYWCNEGQHEELNEFCGYSNILNIFEACVEFIKWYNQNK